MLLALLMSPAARAEPESPKFAMMVVEDAAAGNDILNGSIDSATRKLAAMKGKKRKGFATHTNTCVAYLKAKQVAKASEACDEALSFARAQMYALGSKRRKNKLRAHQVQFELAVALSNQGVLLAVTGETERAMQAFDSAAELKLNRKLVRNNIKRLNALKTDSMPGETTGS